MSYVAPSKMPTADEIFGRELAPAPWLSSRPVLVLVVEVLPTIEDDLAADLLEYLGHALVDGDDELRAIRAVLSSALTLTHTQHVEIIRLRQRLANLLNPDDGRGRPHEYAERGNTRKCARPCTGQA